MENKIVAVLNENKPIGTIMNALGHMALGLGAAAGSEECRLTDYRDADGGSHDNISEMPFIVLKANSNKIRQLRKVCIEQGIQYVDFNDTMTVGTYQEQIKRASETKEETLDYYGIVMIGPLEKVSEMTRKFSLWR